MCSLKSFPKPVYLIFQTLKINAVYLDDCTPVPELQSSLAFAEHYGTPSLRSFDCKLKRTADGKNCLFLFATSAESIVAVQQGRVRWAREEALANIIDSQFLDLPLADTEGTLENEMKGKAGKLSYVLCLIIISQTIIYYS